EFVTKDVYRILKKTEHETYDELITLLLNSDIREYGSPWLGDLKKASHLEANGRIVQLTRLRNISIPQATEDLMLNSSSDHRGPCLLRFTFTDGRNQIFGLDMQNKSDLNIDIPPGTKFRLIGSIPLVMGFLLLSKKHIVVLGGTVNNLIREWNMNKFLKGTDNRLIGSGAPMFVPFGSREASCLIQTEGKFLNQLRSDRERNQMKFDSFQMITNNRNEDQEENELQTLFNEHRKEVLAELKSSTSLCTSHNHISGNDHDDDVPNNINNTNDHQRIFSGNKPRRFRPGLSRFYEIQSQKSMEYDLSLSKLLSLGYPYQIANRALRDNHNNYQVALDCLLSKSTSLMHIEDNSIINNHITNNTSRGIRSRGVTGRGYERGHRGSGRHDSDGYGFNSNRSSIGTTDDHNTLLIRPSTGLTPQNISGDYEEAQLIGHFSTQQFKTFNGSNITIDNNKGSGEKVVLVIYHHQHKNNPELIVDEEEIVPISLIRTLNKEKITIDMVPAAPLDRIRPYCVQSQSEYKDVNRYDEIPSTDYGLTDRPYQSRLWYNLLRGNAIGLMIHSPVLIDLVQSRQPGDLLSHTEFLPIPKPPITNLIANLLPNFATGFIIETFILQY
ncbi:hypothetical protein Smp_001095, partial [Schistosoma mansoni]|uniref:hypothetical protein n=1 Tax=Schistosoma mansoni TaxID=6183 RepID=UPI00022DC753